MGVTPAPKYPVEALPIRPGAGWPRDLLDRVPAGMLSGDPTDDDVCLMVLSATR